RCHGRPHGSVVEQQPPVHAKKRGGSGNFRGPAHVKVESANADGGSREAGGAHGAKDWASVRGCRGLGLWEEARLALLSSRTSAASVGIHLQLVVAGFGAG